MRNALLIVAMAAVAVSAPARGEETKNEKESLCCFDREAYPGYCRVAPGEDETCASILEYLNTPGSGGKTYCGGSKLRGGWTKIDCKSAEEDEKKKE